MKIYNYFKNIAEEIISQGLRVKNIDETRNYLTEKINQNKLMSKKHRKVSTNLNYIENFLILGSAITACVSISAFASLVCILIGIMSYAIGLKICARTVAIKKLKAIIKTKKRSMIKKYSQ